MKEDEEMLGPQEEIEEVKVEDEGTYFEEIAEENEEENAEEKNEVKEEKRKRRRKRRRRPRRRQMVVHPSTSLRYKNSPRG